MRSYHERADIDLCHILSLLEYGPDDLLSGNKKIYQDVPNMMTSIRSRLMSKTKLTNKALNVTIQRDEFEEARENTIMSEEENCLNEIENTLLARLPRDEIQQTNKKS